MSDNIYEIEDGVLVKYNGGAVAEIPEGVVEIGEYSFTGCDDVERVIVPKSVKRIGQQTFRGCSLLREINLPEGLERIARFAFCECGSLENIVIPEGVAEIGNSAFRGCDMLKTAVLPESVERIGESAFSDCVSLESINIPKGTDVIRKRCFSSCRSLTEVFIPDGVREICDHAFDNCAGLSAVRLPDSLRSIGKHSFSSCTSLSEIKIPQGVGYIGSSAFYGTPLLENDESDCVIVGDGILLSWKGSAETAILPEGVISVGENAFTGSADLKKAVLPESVKRICDYAFEHCPALESVQLPEGLADIGSRAFIDCAALSDIKLPDKLRHIGSDAFYGTAMLAALNDEVLVLNGKYLIRAAAEGRRFAVPEGVELIADNAVSGSFGVEEVILPGTVKYIGNAAFKWLAGLRSAVIPCSVEVLGDEAFINSSELSAVIEPAGLTLGENVFPHSSRLTLKNSGRSFTVVLSDDSGGSTPVVQFAAAPSGESFAQLDDISALAPAACCYADCIPECAAYLKENIAAALCYSVDIEDVTLTEQLLSLDYAGEAELQAAVEHAISAGRHEQQVIIMRYKNESFGDRPVDELVDDKFAL